MAPREPLLTKRQSEVVLALMRGRTTAQAAAELGMSVSSARTHIRRALERTGLVGCGRSALFALVLQERAEPEVAEYVAPDAQGRFDEYWKPSPAQRLYLDAFDRLLRARSPQAVAEAEDDMDFFFAGMLRERRCRNPRRRDFDAVMLRLARALTS